MEQLIEVRNLSKAFPGVQALSDINFDLREGEVHAIVGENGAGKSTLIKCLIGAHKPSSGTIKIAGEVVNFNSPIESSILGIEAVHQELMLVPWLSVKQNIFLNREVMKHGSFDLKTMGEQSKKLLMSFGLDIDVNKPVRHYNPSVWKMIDIARVVNLSPRVIIFDEPTAILTEREVNSLFEKIKELKKACVSIIYISHRLNELPLVADRVSILRDGCLIDVKNVNDITEDELVTKMVGRDVSNYYNRNINKPGKELIRFDNVCLKKGQKNINLAVKEGEIVGLAGLVGAGRTEVAESLVGLNKVVSGTIFVNGEKCHPKSPSRMIKKGVVLLPEDRKYSGLILSYSMGFNISLAVFKSWSKIIYNKKKERESADLMIKTLSIRTPSASQLVRNLSGGNQQKVVMAKALLVQSKLMILDEPTVGVDIGAKEEIHQQMDDFVKKGNSILVVSSDLPEIIGICDRVYVMYENEIVKEVVRKDFSEEYLAKFMLRKEK